MLPAVEDKIQQCPPLGQLLDGKERADEEYEDRRGRNARGKKGEGPRMAGLAGPGSIPALPLASSDFERGALLLCLLPHGHSRAEVFAASWLSPVNICHVLRRPCGRATVLVWLLWSP